jgi:hypothetical protein
VKEVGSMDWISTSNGRGVGAMSGGILLGLCILFLDRVIIHDLSLMWAFGGCSEGSRLNRLDFDE